MGQGKQTKITAIPAGSSLHSVCHLYIHRKTWGGLRNWYGTGSAVLFRERYLLTAGHNVYQDNSTIRSVEVRVGVTDARASPIHETIESWQALDAHGYKPEGARRRMPDRHDFGVIRLNRAVAAPSPFRLGGPLQENTQVHFAGYPGDPHSGWEMFSADTDVKTPGPNLVEYRLQTYKSNSGGPVWTMQDGIPHLAAIHIKGSTGRLANEEYIGEIEQLIKELDRRASERGF